MDVCEVQGIRTFILVNVMYQGTSNIYLWYILPLLLGGVLHGIYLLYTPSIEKILKIYSINITMWNNKYSTGSLMLSCMTFSHKGLKEYLLY